MRLLFFYPYKRLSQGLLFLRSNLLCLAQKALAGPFLPVLCAAIQKPPWAFAQGGNFITELMQQPLQ